MNNNSNKDKDLLDSDWSEGAHQFTRAAAKPHVDIKSTLYEL